MLVGTIANVEDGQTINISITDSQGTIQEYTTEVSGGTWTLTLQDYSSFAEGELTVVANTIDIAGNPTTATDTIVKDTLANIIAAVDDGGDGVLNSFEIQSAKFFGTVQNVEDGQTVNIRISDSTTNVIMLTATVIDSAWSVEGVDLTSFSDGGIQIEADTVDVAGNPASAINSAGQIVIDTVSPVIDIDTLDGFSILAFRSGQLTTMQGTTNVAEGLPVYIEVNDGTQTLVFEGVVDFAGNWVVENIDISTLNSSAEWTIDAKVFNTVGNEAIDDMPTIILPESVVFSENIIGIFGGETQTSDIRIDFADFSFSADQTIAESLTSQSLSITITVSGDKQSLTGTRSDGQIVFDASISGTNVNINFYKAIDQESGLDSIQTALIIEGLTN